MGKKKPLIRQAGSAEAFKGSATTGREHKYCITLSMFFKIYRSLFSFDACHGSMFLPSI